MAMKGKRKRHLTFFFCPVGLLTASPQPTQGMDGTATFIAHTKPKGKGDLGSCMTQSSDDSQMDHPVR